MVYLKAQGKGCPGSHRLALKMSAIAAGEYGNLGLSPGQVRDRIKLGAVLPSWFLKTIFSMNSAMQ